MNGRKFPKRVLRCFFCIFCFLPQVEGSQDPSSPEPSYQKTTCFQILQSPMDFMAPEYVDVELTQALATTISSLDRHYQLGPLTLAHRPWVARELPFVKGQGGFSILKDEANDLVFIVVRKKMRQQKDDSAGGVTFIWEDRAFIQVTDRDEFWGPGGISVQIDIRDSKLTFLLVSKEERVRLSSFNALGQFTFFLGLALEKLRSQRVKGVLKRILNLCEGQIQNLDPSPLCSGLKSMEDLGEFGGTKTPVIRLNYDEKEAKTVFLVLNEAYLTLIMEKTANQASGEQGQGNQLEKKYFTYDMNYMQFKALVGYGQSHQWDQIFQTLPSTDWRKLPKWMPTAWGSP